MILEFDMVLWLLLQEKHMDEILCYAQELMANIIDIKMNDIPDYFEEIPTCVTVHQLCGFPSLRDVTNYFWTFHLYRFVRTLFALWSNSALKSSKVYRRHC